MRPSLLRQTKTVAALGVFSAISVVLVALIHFPIFPVVSFLEYDPADIPILICTFIFGPYAGLMVTVVAAVVQGLTVSSHSGVYGIIMHILSTGTYVCAAGFIYRSRKNMLSAGAGIATGTLAMTTVMIFANLLITPLFMGAPVEAVIRLLPLIILFNLIKAGANGVITLLLYRPVALAAKKAGL